MCNQSGKLQSRNWMHEFPRKLLKPSQRETLNQGYFTLPTGTDIKGTGTLCAHIIQRLWRSHLTLEAGSIVDCSSWEPTQNLKNAKGAPRSKWKQSSFIHSKSFSSSIPTWKIKQKGGGGEGGRRKKIIQHIKKVFWEPCQTKQLPDAFHSRWTFLKALHLQLLFWMSIESLWKW